jgi:hypothetical protein
MVLFQCLSRRSFLRSSLAGYAAIAQEPGVVLRFESSGVANLKLRSLQP